MGLDEHAPMARTKRQTWTAIFAAIVIFGALFALWLPSIETPGPRRRSPCKNNLKLIGLALLNYEAEHGALPPAYIADKHGVPMHSWRVLILPYLEQPELFARYDFSHPWNSPKNSELAKLMPKDFRCPNSKNTTPGHTSYLAVVGPGRIFEGTKSTRLDEITDGASNTIMVMEVPDPQQIPWLSPLDAPIVTAQSSHPTGGNVIMGDGSVQFLESDINPEKIAALQSIAGGERTQPEDPPDEVLPHLNQPMGESLPVDRP